MNNIFKTISIATLVASLFIVSTVDASATITMHNNNTNPQFENVVGKTCPEELYQACSDGVTAQPAETKSISVRDGDVVLWLGNDMPGNFGGYTKDAGCLQDGAVIEVHFEWTGFPINYDAITCNGQKVHWDFL